MTYTTRSSILVYATVFACTFLVVLAGPNRANAQLNNENFDSPFTTADFDVFTTTAVDVWGAESAEAVSGPVDGILPAEGDQMARLTDGTTTGTFNQVKQRIDAGFSFADEIAAGNLAANFFACFNAPLGTVGASADILLKWFDAGGTEIGTPAMANLILDSDPDTWEHISLGNTIFDAGPNISVPVGTQFVEAHFQFDNASLGNFAGYADKTHLGFVVIPEPSSLLLFLAGVALFSCRRWRRR